MDLILSSGFLAFARHLGVLEALEELGIGIDAIVGTSSGALVAALYQAGHSIAEIARLLSEQSPLRSLRFHPRPWEGLCSPRRMEEKLLPYLPATFAALPRPLALGVCDEQGRHRLLFEGELMSALLASTAIPRVFPPVLREGQRYVDGGVADRLGLTAWRAWRPGREVVAHIVERSRGKEVPMDGSGVRIVRTPRSGASFFSLGPFEAQQREARDLALAQLGG